MNLWPETCDPLLRPLKHACRLNPDTLPESTDPDYEFDYVDIGSVNLESGIVARERMDFAHAPSRARKPVRPNDVIVSTVRTYLKAVAFIDERADSCVVSTGFAVLRPNASVEPRFLYRVIQSNPFIEAVVAASTGVSYPAITPSALGAIPIVLPGQDSQVRIARFLDSEIVRLDQLIEKKQRLGFVLREKEDAEIVRTLLGQHKKESLSDHQEIEWLGKVPSRWKVRKAKYVFRLACRPAPSNNDFELLSVYTDIGVKPRRELEQKGNKASTTDGYWMVQRGDIVVNKLLAWMGAVGYSDYSGVTSPAYDVLRPYEGVNSRYYHYLFRSPLAQQEFRRHSRGIMEMRLRLYFEQLGNISLPQPPLNEQDEIVARIDGLVSQRIQRIRSLIEAQIRLISEFRSALITAAVTGQIDVASWRRGGETDRRLDRIEEEMSQREANI